MKIILNQPEARALQRLRGLPPGAHMLLMCFTWTTNGGVLDGSREDLAELVGFISEELGEGLATRRDVPHLVSVCEKIDPECRDWLGM